MNKISQADVGAVMQASAGVIRDLSNENQELKTKVAQFEKVAQAEKLATLMEEKNLEPELSHQQKVAGLLRRENLDVVEEAIGLSAPQMKLASIAEDSNVSVEHSGSSDQESGQAESTFLTNLARS